MRKFPFFVFLFFIIGVNGQTINIPDPIFKAKLLLPANDSVAKDILGNYITVDANGDGEIQVNEALQVYKLGLHASNISSLTGIEAFTNLTYITCQNNQITSLDVSSMPNLYYLDCSYNQITSLDVSGLANLYHLDCNYNQITSLNVSGTSDLYHLDCSHDQITNLDLTGLSNLRYLYANNNQLQTLNMSGLTYMFDFNASYNNQLDVLDFVGMTSVNSLRCDGCGLNSLNISGVNIQTLYCSYNQLTTLDLSAAISLSVIDVNYNSFTSLDLSGLIHLYGLNCMNNLLTTLNTQDLTNLHVIRCQSNQFETLDLSNCKLLTEIYAQDNSQLKSLFIKNGRYQGTVNFTNDNQLNYICADENEITYIRNHLYGIGLYNSCEVNTYCSFTPGGTFYTIQGKNIFDADLNGCDANDPTFPRLKYNVTNGTTEATFTSDNSGNYMIATPSGNQVVTLILENPSYFVVSPPDFSVNFPSTASPSLHDFCISPNGTHPDLEISLVPIDVARPGFDANYKIIYKNKGTHAQSGSINMSFDDTILEVTDANPDTVGPSPESLVWTFTDLQPFESRTIYITINLNSPVETPSLQGGEILHYTVAISSSQTDETPADNTFTLNQTVVNSLDPNDKTCLEGNTVSPDMVGKYVHYMIRFENTGTANAENIVVKDMIDTSKFDISSLIPLDGSHPFTTRISDTNKVEFIFENIQLPFDDANNDGYVAFKIKTGPTLVVGNTFSNTANIYFDYNAPIVTNTATTAIQVLGTDDFDFNTQFTLFPNPVNDTLKIKSKDNTIIHSISVYNILGQLILTVANPMENINVSELTAGNYIISIITDKGKASSKFIKR
ncbi:DUF7619 domain-containing protein [Flavobacterium pallidum]|uniref:T9SS C-terminal target domain-containing protein n=1 Tax=Flavobacterium pallidum TaxID=2172098 RepID=A0A2S1SJY1_9FLAO|nr:leucine-rich repeat domain-containing protein [Flavobacterium pallidum]AWI26676.1 T9SS C-terminal target domain-containing protein [Flavobacterium pallidum]